MPDFLLIHGPDFGDTYKNIGQEMERICKQGNLTPRQWMIGAVGSDISAEALIKAATEAVTALQKTWF